MNYKLDADILNDAHQCRRDFSCLNGNGDCLCKVERLIEHNLLFIKPALNNICNYRMSFGYSAYYCNCPVRVELFKRCNV
ncbi:MAG: hypothetical protein AB1499_07540 [Nitrospirota bacterium]